MTLCAGISGVFGNQLMSLSRSRDRGGCSFLSRSALEIPGLKIPVCRLACLLHTLPPAARRRFLEGSRLYFEDPKAARPGRSSRAFGLHGSSVMSPHSQYCSPIVGIAGFGFAWQSRPNPVYHERSEVGGVGRAAAVQGPADLLGFRMAIACVSLNNPLGVPRTRQHHVPSGQIRFGKKPFQSVTCVFAAGLSETSYECTNKLRALCCGRAPLVVPFVLKLIWPVVASNKANEDFQHRDLELNIGE